MSSEDVHAFFGAAADAGSRVNCKRTTRVKASRFAALAVVAQCPEKDVAFVIVLRQWSGHYRYESLRSAIVRTMIVPLSAE
jgi:hypothetical protein